MIRDYCIDESISSETARFRWRLRFRAIEFHRLHPFFPTGVLGGYAEANEFHKEIMKAFLVFFFSVKLIVLARRVKERMYAPGGSGFIAAEKSFDRAAKAIYENFEEADRAAKSQRIE